MITQIVAPAYGQNANTTPLTKAQMATCRKIANLLNSPTLTFNWEDTAEGSGFWESVYERLLAIADGEALK